jgi:hypothetical protein
VGVFSIQISLRADEQHPAAQRHQGIERGGRLEERFQARGDAADAAR